MKILLVTDQFFSANNGMTISGRRFAQVLRSHGHEVEVVSTGTPQDTRFCMPELHVPVFDKLILSQGMMFAATDEPLLQEAIEWADVVHFLTPFALSHHGILLCRMLKKPFTCAFHVQPENITSSIHLEHLGFVNSGIYHWFHAYIFKYAKYVHCPSNFIAEQLVKHGYHNSLQVISNGIDPDFTYHRDEKPADLADRFIILTIGRYSVEKRQAITMQAIARSRYRDRITLIAAGQGPTEKKLRRVAKKLGIDVRFGFYTKPELLRIIGYSDLYVHAAAAEIEAMACMEAFACGLVPVIADSHRSATPQFALDRRSLFRTDHASELAEKIDYWIDHPQEREKMGKQYTQLSKRYALDECVRKAETMFQAAIDDNGVNTHESHI